MKCIPMKSQDIVSIVFTRIIGTQGLIGITGIKRFIRITRIIGIIWIKGLIRITRDGFLKRSRF